MYVQNHIMIHNALYSKVSLQHARIFPIALPPTLTFLEEQTANSKQQTANSKQQTANSKQQTNRGDGVARRKLYVINFTDT